MSEYLELDPRDLHVPSSRLSGADPVKLHDQTRRFGSSLDGMPPILVYRGSDAALMIYDGVTRATRAARQRPGRPIRVEIIRTLARPVGQLPLLGALLP